MTKKRQPSRRPEMLSPDIAISSFRSSVRIHAIEDSGEEPTDQIGYGFFYAIRTNDRCHRRPTRALPESQRPDRVLLVHHHRSGLSFPPSA